MTSFVAVGSFVECEAKLSIETPSGAKALSLKKINRNAEQDNAISGCYSIALQNHENIYDPKINGESSKDQFSNKKLTITDPSNIDFSVFTNEFGEFVKIHTKQKADEEARNYFVDVFSDSTPHTAYTFTTDYKPKSSRSTVHPSVVDNFTFSLSEQVIKGTVDLNYHQSNIYETAITVTKNWSVLDTDKLTLSPKPKSYSLSFKVVETEENATLTLEPFINNNPLKMDSEGQENLQLRDWKKIDVSSHNLEGVILYKLSNGPKHKDYFIDTNRSPYIAKEKPPQEKRLEWPCTIF